MPRLFISPLFFLSSSLITLYSTVTDGGGTATHSRAADTASVWAIAVASSNIFTSAIINTQLALD